MNTPAACLAAALLLAPLTALSAVDQDAAENPTAAAEVSATADVAEAEADISTAVPPNDTPQPEPEPAAGTAATTEELAEPTAETEVVAASAPSHDWVKLTLNLSYELKNLSLGFSLRYWDYLQTDISTDFLLTALLMGLGLDDLNAFRVTLSETAGFRIHTGPFEISSRFGGRPEPGPIPAVILGAGIWGLIELDSLAQLMRLGDAGVFMSASAGFFATFVFSAIDVSFAYRPISTTGYYLDNAWDSTLLQFGNPVLELSLSYTLPW